MSKVQWWFRRRWNMQLSPPFPANLASLVPSTCVHGAASQAITVNGNYFQPGAKLNFGASVYSATYVSSTQLTVTIAAADLATAGSKTVTVFNTDGRNSNSLTFTIT